jgi:isoleucyl-tRNA synthetase
MKAVQEAVRAADPAALRSALDAKGSVALKVDGDTIDLSQDELVVGVEAKEGFAAAGDAVGVVILDTKLTDALREDMLFREILAKLQARRKELKLDFAARIKLGLTGSAKLIEICRARAEALKKEILAADLVLGAPVGGASAETTVEGEALVIDVVNLGVPALRGTSHPGAQPPRG